MLGRIWSRLRNGAGETRRAAARTVDGTPVKVRDIRRGDRFAEVGFGGAVAYCALEDARDCRSGSRAPGHAFRALGERGEQEFFCALGWDCYGPQLHRLSPDPAGSASLAAPVAQDSGAAPDPE